MTVVWGEAAHFLDPLQLGVARAMLCVTTVGAGPAAQQPGPPASMLPSRSCQPPTCTGTCVLALASTALVVPLLPCLFPDVCCTSCCAPLACSCSVGQLRNVTSNKSK